MQQRQGLLLLDLIADLVDRLTPTGHPVPANWRHAASAARRSGVLLTYVKVDFRPGYPEIAERNVLFGAIAESGRLRGGTPETTLHPASAATPTDIVVTKRRVSAFAGSDLELILRAHEIDT